MSAVVRPSGAICTGRALYISCPSDGPSSTDVDGTNVPPVGRRHPSVDWSTSTVLAIYNGRKRPSTIALNEPPLRVSRLTNVEQQTQGVKRGRKHAQSKNKAKKSRVERDSEAIAALERIKDARHNPVGGV